MIGAVPVGTTTSVRPEAVRTWTGADTQPSATATSAAATSPDPQVSVSASTPRSHDRTASPLSSSTTTKLTFAPPLGKSGWALSSGARGASGRLQKSGQVTGTINCGTPTTR